MEINEVFKIFNEQKNSKNTLIELEENFYERCSSLIKNLIKDLEEIDKYKHDDLDTYLKLLNKKEKSLLGAKKTIETLIYLRLDKLLDIALFSVKKKSFLKKPKGLTKEELLFLERIIKEINLFNTKVIEKILEGKKIDYENIEEKKENSKKIPVVIKEYVPQFVGDNFKIYGPFEPQEIVNLPEQSANILIKKNKAEKLI